MEQVIIYMLRLAFCLTLFFIGFKAFLSKETFFRFNRYVLLLGTVVCMALPFAHIGIHSSTPISAPATLMEEALSGIPEYELQATITEKSVIENKPDIKSTPQVADVPTIDPSPVSILIAIYVIGGAINILFLAKSIVSMTTIIRHGRKSVYGKNILVITNKTIAPFSWRRYIIISESDYNENRDEILAHELAHIQSYHSYDLLFMEAIRCFQWFNPAVWLLKRELKDIHEYQADMHVLQTGIDATKYQLLLVKKAVGSSSYTLANSFNHSKIKKRITMMLKEKSKNSMRFKLALLAPAAMLAIFAFAQPKVNDENTNNFAETKLGEQKTANEMGSFCFPLKNVMEITQAYGLSFDPVYKTKKFHLGVDMTVNANDTIYAAFDGIVTASTQEVGYGKIVKIAHENDLQTWYAHNAKNLVEEYDNVKAGEPIALVGNTGKSAGKHLHFEMHKNAEAFDPTILIDFERKSYRNLADTTLQERDKSKKLKFTKPIITNHPERTYPNSTSALHEIEKSQKQSTDIRASEITKYENNKGNTPKGEFKNGFYAERDSETLYFAHAYAKDKKSEKFEKIEWYVIGDKKYNEEEFISKYKGQKVFYNRKKIKPEYGQTTEVQGITTEGSTTPTFYMVPLKTKIETY